MIVYRVVKKKYEANPFSGKGAKEYGGRWNSIGVEAVYGSSSEALCVLEILAHADGSLDMKNIYDLYKIDIPDELVIRLDDGYYPDGWDSLEDNEDSQDVGDDFLLHSGEDSAVLAVRSAIARRDYNFLIKPNHKQVLESFKNAEKLEFEFDKRLLKD